MHPQGRVQVYCGITSCVVMFVQLYHSDCEPMWNKQKEAGKVCLLIFSPVLNIKESTGGSSDISKGVYIQSSSAELVEQMLRVGEVAQLGLGAPIRTGLTAAMCFLKHTHCTVVVNSEHFLIACRMLRFSDIPCIILCHFFDFSCLWKSRRCHETISIGSCFNFCCFF